MSGYYHKCQVLMNVEIIMFYYESEFFFLNFRGRCTNPSGLK